MQQARPIGRAFLFFRSISRQVIAPIFEAGFGLIRYSDPMFDVLVYLYEHYWRSDACPDSDMLARKLSAVGFEADEIREALAWLDGLSEATQDQGIDPADSSIRVYSGVELEHVGPEALGFLRFLESAGVLSPRMREVVLDRALVVPGGPIALDDLKVIVLMVFWSLGEEPDALILDELFADDECRQIH